jgi:hypothetical protein
MPDNELVGVKKSEEKEEIKLPKPTGWRLLKITEAYGLETFSFTF